MKTGGERHWFVLSTAPAYMHFKKNSLKKQNKTNAVMYPYKTWCRPVEWRVQISEGSEETCIIWAYTPLELQTCFFSSRQHLLFWSIRWCLLAFHSYMGHIQVFAAQIAWSFHLSGPQHRAGGPQKPSNPETGPSPWAGRTGPSSVPQSGPRGLFSHNSTSPACGMPTMGHSSWQTPATLQEKRQHIKSFIKDVQLLVASTNWRHFTTWNVKACVHCWRITLETPILYSFILCVFIYT